MLRKEHQKERHNVDNSNMGYNINEKNPKKYQLEQTLEKGSKLACLKVKQGKNTLNWL